MKVLVCLVTVSIFVHAALAGGGTYNYDTVEAWPTEFAESCAGEQQSPIDIDSEDAVYDEFDEMILSGYDDVDGVSQSLVNNGHTVELSLNGNYSLSGAGLSAVYHAAQLHFHWGSTGTQGSEHTIDGQPYPAEMHIVHVKDGLTLDEAVLVPSGIAVLGVHIEVGGADNTDFAPMIDAIDALVGDESVTLNSTIVLFHLLPESINHFFRYDGSLTTPTCNEVVIWTVFENTVKISDDQLNVFRSLTDEDSHSLSDNYRPTQPLNERILYKSYGSGAIVSSLSVMLMLVTGSIMRLSM